MKVGTFSEVQSKFAEYLQASAKEPVILTSNGKPVAVLDGTLDADDFERLRLAYNPAFRKIIADAERRFQEGKGIPHDEFWRKIKQEYPGAFVKKPAKQKNARRSGQDDCSFSGSAMRIVVVTCLAACCLCSASVAGTPVPAQVQFFESRIRPVLVENCFSCHGPKKQNADLRLDSRQAMLKGNDEGAVIVPGHPEKSRLIRAIQQAGKIKMPPKAKLPAQVIADLTTWIKMGAPWPDTTVAGPVTDDAWKTHWGFQPIRNPRPPDVKDGAWPRTPSDRFILAKLEEKGLRPSPAADRRTLIRRATFDLIGLPPTPEEIAAFEKDSSPDAFAKVVDRLLASPHYGERWGRYWLDVARYADTKGYVFFEESAFTWAYTYRDYVIRAFNDDLPYDRFILEQLAADYLVKEHGDRRVLPALGFLSLGGRFMNNVHDILDDRIDVVTRGLMGLTVTCARCHDHKYDPIPTQDYYSLYGVFASTTEPTVPPLFQPEPKTEEYAKFDKELKAREHKLTEFVRKKHEELTTQARTRVAEYLLAAHALRDQPSTEEFMLLTDTNDLNPTMISRWHKYLERTRKKHDPVFAVWHAFAELPAEEFAFQAAAVCEKLKSHDAVRPINPLVRQAFAEPPTSLKEVAERYGKLLNAVEQRWHALRLPDPQAVLRLPAFAAEEQLHQVFHAPEAPPNVALLPYGDLSLLPDRPSQGKLQELRKALESWRATGPAAPPRAMVLEDLPTPVEPRVLLRGNPNQSGEAVPRQFVGVLAGPKREPFRIGSGRLELARAIVSRDNPLTARALVNRLWLHHFGAGLVRTPSDFGLRSDPPSHPELLDYLAATFRDGGWSIKKMHRLIMLSAVYQQSSEFRTPNSEFRTPNSVDPDNRLLWHYPRRRLDFEAARDALLAVSGRLDRSLGGPAVKDILSPKANRRTLYVHLDRLNVPGLFRTFDFPSPDATSPARDTTTVAPQALFFMNNPFVLECAHNLLKRADIAGLKDLAAKVDRLYWVCYGRPASAADVDLAQDYVRDRSDVAWQRYVQALLLANEFVFVD